MTDDLTLFARIKYKRDTKAFDELFKRWYETLVNYALRFVDIAEAENIVQEFMVYLWENAKKIEIHSSFQAYILHSTKNRCINFLQREEVKKNIQENSLLTTSAVHSLDPLLEDELRSLIRDELEKIPLKQRSLFEKNRFNGQTYREISEETGVNIKTVEYRISQVLKHLRNSLKDYMS